MTTTKVLINEVKTLEKEKNDLAYANANTIVKMGGGFNKCSNKINNLSYDKYCLTNNLSNEKKRTQQLELLLISTKNIDLIKETFKDQKIQIHYKALVYKDPDGKVKDYFMSVWGKKQYNITKAKKTPPILNYYITYKEEDFDIDLTKNGYDIFIYKHNHFYHNEKYPNVEVVK